jgi:Predicted Zn-dependent peptidases
MGMNRLFIKSPVNDVAVINLALNLGSLQELVPGIANVLIPLWRMSNYAKELERMGVSFVIEKGLDYLMVRVKARYSVISKAVELLVKTLLNPPIGRLDNAIREAGTRITLSREDVVSLSIAESLKLLFNGHPYSRHPAAYEYKLTGITKDDVRRAIDGLRAISLTVVALEDVVEVDLPSANYMEIPVREFGSGNENVRLEGKVQTAIVIMYPTHSIKDVERSFRMDVANTVIGGMGLVSRLYREVRVKRGLAYYAYSMYWPLGSSGVFIAMAGVRREFVKDTIDIMLNTISNSSLSDDELAMAVRNRIGRLKVMKESPEGIANVHSIIPTYGLSNDYYDKYINYIRNIRPEDVAYEIRSLREPVVVAVGA